MSRKIRSVQTFQLPTTISGLWALCPLLSIKDEDGYDTASEICARLAVRRLNSVQKEYFRELTALVEDYEDRHGLLEKTKRALCNGDTSWTFPAAAQPEAELIEV